MSGTTGLGDNVTNRADPGTNRANSGTNRVRDGTNPPRSVLRPLPRTRAFPLTAMPDQRALRVHAGRAENNPVFDSPGRQRVRLESRQSSQGIQGRGTPFAMRRLGTDAECARRSSETGRSLTKRSRAMGIVSVPWRGRWAAVSESWARVDEAGRVRSSGCDAAIRTQMQHPPMPAAGLAGIRMRQGATWFLSAERS